jgi:fluoroacetyl-CoA thioesterase
MPHPDLQPGLTFCRSIVVDERLTGFALSRKFVGLGDMPPVLATPFLVGLVEWTCVEGLRPYLREGEHSVGTLIDVNHIAATPVGVTVSAEVRLLAVIGRKLRFLVSCHNEYELVGKGNHERTLIHSATFTRRARMKGGHVGMVQRCTNLT